MDKKKSVYYLIPAIVAFLPFCLIFNDNIWFDEAFTLSLIQHSYSDVVAILKSDMHPPLYFLSLKAFCDVLGYSVPVTKIFSALGFTVMILCGSGLIAKRYDQKTAVMFSLASGAIPMMFYFSVQQRAYSWGVCFVTLCFLFGVSALKNGKRADYLLMAVTGLLAAYLHFFALLAIALVYAYVNVTVLFKKRKEIRFILLSDGIMIAGYSFWFLTLLRQAEDAVNDFWLNGVETLSVIVFCLSLPAVGAFLLIKENRRGETLFASFCVVGLQVIGLLGTILVRPFYIGRYSIVISGIGACLIAFGSKPFKNGLKKVFPVILSVLLIANLILIGVFEYDSSIRKFRQRFDSELSDRDGFLYFDTSFGVMSYYYPENKHLCTDRKDWYDAFGNVDYIAPQEVVGAVADGEITWIVKNAHAKFPAYITDSLNVEKEDAFQCDFNEYEVYAVSVK